MTDTSNVSQTVALTDQQSKPTQTVIAWIVAVLRNDRTHQRIARLDHHRLHLGVGTVADSTWGTWVRNPDDLTGPELFRSRIRNLRHFLDYSA